MSPLLLLLAAAPVDASALLAQARAQVDALKYRDAERTLQPVADARDLARADVLAYFELQARIAGTLGHADRAARWFERLVELEPTFSLGERASPKLSGPLFEARAAVDKRGPLRLEVQALEERGRLTALRPTLTGPTGRAARLLVSLEEDGATRQVELASSPTPDSVPVSAASLGVTVRLVDAKGWTLLEHTSRHVATAALPATVTLTPRQAPTAPGAAAVPLAREQPRHKYVTLRWTALGVGVAAAVAGGSMYWVSTDARAQFNSAVSFAQGTRLDLTEVQARELGRQAQFGELGAVAAWALAGGLIVTGIILWIAGAPAEAP